MTEKPQLENSIMEFIKVIKEISPASATQFHLSFSHTEIDYGFTLTMPDRIYMKNIKGEWIK